jgi:hypothetical protein
VNPIPSIDAYVPVRWKAATGHRTGEHRLLMDDVHMLTVSFACRVEPVDEVAVARMCRGLDHRLSPSRSTWRWKPTGDPAWFLLVHNWWDIGDVRFQVVPSRGHAHWLDRLVAGLNDGDKANPDPVAGRHPSEGVVKPGDRGWIEFDGTTTEVIVMQRESGTRLRVRTVATGGVLIVEGHHVQGARHRHGDPDTAVAAANAQTEERVTAAQWKVLAALFDAGEIGMIDDAHELKNGLGRDTAGKRRGELQHKGLVEPHPDKGQDGKGLTRRGSWATRWRLTEEGRKVYMRLRASGLPRQGEVA